MSRQITVEGIARAVRYLERAFNRYDDEAIVEAVKRAGFDHDTIAFVGEFLVGITTFSEEDKVLPKKPEPKCAFCGGEGEGRKNMDDTLTRANNIYCSNACRQKAYRQRKAARYGKKARSDRPSVTKSESVTEAPLETAAQP
jgi:hypothetical protein